MGVGDFFKTVGKAAFPFISTAAVAGGPFTTMAANVVGKALGITPGQSSEDIEKAMASAVMNPDQMLALQKAENDFKVQMDQLNISLEQIAAGDRDSARKREMAVKDYTPEIGFYLLCGIFVYGLHYLLLYEVPAGNKASVYSMLGSLGTLVIMAATYFYGTTRDSGRKTELLAAAPAVANGNGPKSK